MRVVIISEDIPRKHTEQSLMAHRLLEQTLREEGYAGPMNWCQNEHGKPYIPGAPCFSISHCDRAIAIAVADHEVGIDIEPLDRRMSDALRERVGDIQEWTRREAVAKLRGTGIDDTFWTLNPTAHESVQTIVDRERNIVYSSAESTNSRSETPCSNEVCS